MKFEKLGVEMPWYSQSEPRSLWQRLLNRLHPENEKALIQENIKRELALSSWQLKVKQSIIRKMIKAGRSDIAYWLSPKGQKRILDTVEEYVAWSPESFADMERHWEERFEEYKRRKDLG